MATKIKTRIYNANNLELGLEITVNDNDFTHLIKVLRLKKDDFFAVFNKSNGEFLSKIISVEKNLFKAQILEKIKDYKEPRKIINLFYTPLKKEATDFVIEKAIEVGATSLTQVITERTTSKPLEVEKILLKVKNAVEQCGRLDLAYIYPAIKLDKLLSTNKDLLWFNEKREGKNIVTLLKSDALTSEINILIGPEGGFSDSEKQALTNNPKVQSTYIDGNILRAETAAIIALGLATFL